MDKLTRKQPQWFARFFAPPWRMFCLLLLSIWQYVGLPSKPPKNKQDKSRRHKNRDKKQQSATQSQSDAATAAGDVANPLDTEMSTNPGNQQRPSHDEIMQQLERRQVWFNGLLALFAGFGFIVAIIQGRQTQETITRMRFDARPWLYLQASVKEPAPGHMMIKFDLHNDGRSPAYLKTLKLSTFAITPPLDSDKQLRDHERLGELVEAQNIVRPNGTSLLPIPEPLFVNEQIMKELISGKSQFVVFLTVTYTDSDKTIAGESQFCWLYNPSLNDMTEYPKHNHMK